MRRAQRLPQINSSVTNMPAMMKLSATSSGPVTFSLTWYELFTAKKFTPPPI